MCFGCICGDNHTARPWWPTEQRLPNWADEKVLTDCCLRQLPATETICSLRTQELPLVTWRLWRLSGARGVADYRCVGQD